MLKNQILTYMLQDILWGEPGHVWRNFIDGEADVVKSALLLVAHSVRLVLLGHRHLGEGVIKTTTGSHGSKPE